MPMAHIRKVGGEHDLYHVHFLDQRTDPGYGRPEGPGHPDHDLPGSGARPDQGLPGRERPTDPGYGRPGMGAGHPDNSLPWSPGHPANPLPGTPGHRPDQGLPAVKPGYILALVRGTDGKWHYAAIAPGSAPPKPLPEPLPPDATTKPIDPDAPPPPGATLPPMPTPTKA